MNPHSWNEEELIQFAKKFGIDSNGPKSVVLDRLVRYLKQTNQYEPPQDKRKKRSKKKKSAPKPMLEVDDELMREEEDTIVEVVPEELPVDPRLEEFQQIFNRFQEKTLKGVERDDENADRNGDLEEEEDEEANLVDREELRKSRKKLRKLNRMTVAELKQVVQKPELVDVSLVHAVDRCNISGSSAVDLPQVNEKYCTSTSSLGPKTQIFAREEGDGETTV
jgi:splicing factor 3B subunit 2